MCIVHDKTFKEEGFHGYLTIVCCWKFSYLVRTFIKYIAPFLVLAIMIIVTWNMVSLIYCTRRASSVLVDLWNSYCWRFLLWQLTVVLHTTLWCGVTGPFMLLLWGHNKAGKAKLPALLMHHKLNHRYLSSTIVRLSV